MTLDAPKKQLVFGEITAAEAEKTHGIAHQDNPCIAMFGPDLFGRTCKTCNFLVYWGHTRRYYKCKLRKMTHGPGSDHRVNWPACGKWERSK